MRDTRRDLGLLAPEAVEQRPRQTEPPRERLGVVAEQGQRRGADAGTAVVVGDGRGRPVLRAGAPYLGAGGARLRLGLPDERRGLERRGPQLSGVWERGKSRVRHGADELVDADLTPEIGLSGGEIGLSLEQREQCVAEVDGGRERIGARGGAGLELVHGGLQLRLGALYLSLGDADQLLIFKGGKEDQSSRRGHLVALVHKAGGRSILRGRRSAQVGESTEPVEQDETRREAARVRVEGRQGVGGA